MSCTLGEMLSVTVLMHRAKECSVGKRLGAESCSEWGCIKAAKGSGGLPKGSCCECYFMGDLAWVGVELGS